MRNIKRIVQTNKQHPSTLQEVEDLITIIQNLVFQQSSSHGYMSACVGGLFPTLIANRMR